MDRRAVDHVVDRTVTVRVHSAMMGHRRQSMAFGIRLKAIDLADLHTDSFLWKCTKTSRMRAAL
jgi:hypothetical protein